MKPNPWRDVNIEDYDECRDLQKSIFYSDGWGRREDNWIKLYISGCSMKLSFTERDKLEFVEQVDKFLSGDLGVRFSLCNFYNCLSPGFGFPDTGEATCPFAKVFHLDSRKFSCCHTILCEVKDGVFMSFEELKSNGMVSKECPEFQRWLLCMINNIRG